MGRFFTTVLSLKNIIGISALSLATTAAFFSVTGIGALFAGAYIPSLIMAGTLEFSKLVGVSFIYRHWVELPKLLKSYMLVASVVLVFITSAGIYGFLTSAYQKTADQLVTEDAQSQVIKLKRDRYTEQLNLLMADRQRLSENIQELSKGMANNVIQYRDSASGNIITTTSSATRSALQQQLTNSTTEREKLMIKSEELTDSISALDMQSLALRINSDVASEVGPLRYISELSGWEMNRVVNVLILVIVFVFDPLAICMVLAYNFLVKREQTSPEAPQDPQESLPETVTPPTPPELPPVSVADPHPQYMNEAETERMMERWWAKRNGRST